MRAKKTLLAGILVAVMLVSFAGAVSIGTAPGVYDLGELDAGKNVAFRFYLMTNAQNDILVNMNYLPVHQDMYQRSETTRYRFVHTEASQEDISSWVEVVKNPILLSPGRAKVVYLAGGGTVKANEEVDVILRIPDNADPGYHAGSISLSPKIATKAGGTGVTTIAVTRFVFVFRIAGEATRKGEIMTIIGDREEEKKAKVDVIFKNTGTCTLGAYVSELRLYDKFGEEVGVISSGYSIVRPGAMESLTSYWVGDAVKPGTYRVSAKVDYITGYDTMEGTVEIPESIRFGPSKKPSVLEGASFCGSMPYVIMFLVIAALVVYLSNMEGRQRILLVLAALIVLSLGVFAFSCVVSVGASFMDIVFIIIILALIIYWRIS